MPFDYRRLTFAIMMTYFVYIFACYPHVATEFAADSARKTTHVVDAVATKVSAVVASAPTCSASGTSNHLSLTSSIDREAGLECLQCHTSSQSRRGVCGACGYVVVVMTLLSDCKSRLAVNGLIVSGVMATRWRAVQINRCLT